MKICFQIIIVILVCISFGYAQNEVDKFSGLVFYDYSFNTDKQSDKEGYELRRAYFTHTRRLSENLVYKFQADVGRIDSDDRLSVVLKNTKVDWTTSIGTIVIGLQGMNLFDVAEKNWGYRYIEKSAMDHRKFSSSADLGLGFKRTFKKSVHFSVLATNGRGYKRSENDRYKKISTQLTYGNNSLLGATGFNVGAIFSYEPYDFLTEGETIRRKSKVVRGVFAGMATSRVRAGFDIDAKTDNGLNINEQIISVYATLILSPQLNLFSRYDNYDPNRAVGNNAETYTIVGFDYTPETGLTIAPNFRLVSPQNGNNTKVFHVNFQFKF